MSHVPQHRFPKIILFEFSLRLVTYDFLPCTSVTHTQAADAIRFLLVGWRPQGRYGASSHSACDVVAIQLYCQVRVLGFRRGI